MCIRDSAMADFKSDVPQKCDPCFDACAARRIYRRRHQHQQVDVRCGMQLRAAVAADGNQCPGAPLRAELRPPYFAQHRINERGARVD